MKMQRIKKQKGFTLAETLLAVLIMSLVAVILATGMPAAKSAYERVVDAANAQVLLSTTVQALRDELGTARDVKPVPASGGGTSDYTKISYFSADRGSRSEIFKDVNNKEIRIRDYASTAESLTDFGIDVKESDNNGRLLVASEGAASTLYATYDTLAYEQDTGIVSFVNLRVMHRLKNGTEIEVANLGDAQSEDSGDPGSGEVNPNVLSIRVFMTGTQSEEGTPSNDPDGGNEDG